MRQFFPTFMAFTCPSAHILRTSLSLHTPMVTIWLMVSSGGSVGMIFSMGCR